MVDEYVDFLDLDTFSSAGVPSVSIMLGWIKAVIMAFAMFVYIRALLEMIAHYAELDSKSVPTQPITNYGGAVGGVVNAPFKLAQVAVGVGMTALAIGIIATAMNYQGGTVQYAMSGLLAIVYGDSGTAFEGLPFLQPTLAFLDMCIPVAFLLTLLSTYWVLKAALTLNVWFVTKVQRVLS